MTTSLASRPSAGQSFTFRLRSSGGVFPVSTTLGVFSDPQNEVRKASVLWRDGKDSGFGFGLGLAVAMVLLALMGYMWRLGGRGRKLGAGNGASVPCWPLATCSCHLAQRAWRHLGQVKSGRMDGRR